MTDLTIYYAPTISRYLEKASYIAALLNDTEIHTGYVLMAALYEDPIFTTYFMNISGAYFDLPSFIMHFATCKEDFYDVFLSKKDNDEDDIESKVENEDAELNSPVKKFSISELKELINKLTDSFNENESKMSIEDFEKNCKVDFFKTDYRNLEFAPLHSEDLITAFTDAACRCKQYGVNTVDFPNFIYSLVNIEESSAQNLLIYLGIDPCDILDTLEYYYNIYPEYDENDATIFRLPLEVEDFCEVLNSKYSEDVVCDILGRDEEISNFWVIASRKTKKNSILTGQAGCGKTAIVEAITMQIVNKTAPKQFLDYTVISLNLTSMIAGTSYRGQFEEKAKSLIDFLEKKDKVILFIDEIHQVMGAGATSSNEGFSLAGILKPILARDDAIVIGATTTDEYEQFISKDSAFKRRFERIKVKEPKISELKPMIKKKVENLSKYHKISISDELLDYIIIQAYCFNPDTANPDKTISLCDSSMALAKTKGKRVLAKIHVNEVNSLALKHYKELPEDYKLATAYHEAGHYVMARILPKLKYKSTVVLSIIPTDDYEGVHSFEIDESKLNAFDFQYFKENMISLMAGRVSEEYFMHTINSGARNDLAKITDMVREMILVSGMDPEDEFFNLSLLGEYEDDTTFITEDTKEYVLDATKKYVENIYRETKKLVEENKAIISRIAKSLMRRGMLDSNQLDKLFKGKNIVDVEINDEQQLPKKKIVKVKKEK